MLKNVTHSGGVEDVEEILFNTPFGYLFPEAAASPDARLPHSERTQDALLDLGAAMGDPSNPPDPALDSEIPAAFTYLGQFIDHDVTARTDRETGLSKISQKDGRPLPITPLDPKEVIEKLRNGRRPQLDLDSVYGDGPGLVDGVGTEASALYDLPDRLFSLQDLGDDQVDLPRDGRTAIIADGRNDENVNISQLHAAFLAFHNKVAGRLSGSSQRRYAKARQIVRWTYQYIVAHDYLPRVCDRSVVQDVLCNGPYFFGPAASGAGLFMPMEFSVAGFRFGHSMIRPSYAIGNGAPVGIETILGVSTHRPSEEDLLEDGGDSWRLKPDNRIHWANYLEFPGEAAPQKARKIDSLISNGLFDLPFEEATPHTMMRQLAKRNLQRGYLHSLPTGQAAAASMGIVPLSEDDLLTGESPNIVAALEQGRFQCRTPLWYYVLREAKVQTDGETLGSVGSRIVAETLIGFLKHSPNSFLNNRHHGRVRNQGIKVPGRPDPIGTLSEMIAYTNLKK